MPELLPARHENSIGLIPREQRCQQNFLLKRINLPSMEITRNARDVIVAAMASGKAFVQLGEYTLVLSSITSIEPMELLAARPQPPLLVERLEKTPTSVQELIKTRRILPEWLQKRLNAYYPLNEDEERTDEW